MTDELEISVEPHSVIARNGREMEAIRRLVEEREVGEIVIGMPYRESGEVGPRAEAMEAFAQRLEEALGRPVVRFDERYSTMEAEEMLIAQGMRREKRREVIDKFAAAIILRDYLREKRGAQGA